AVRASASQRAAARQSSAWAGIAEMLGIRRKSLYDSRRASLVAPRWASRAASGVAVVFGIAPSYRSARAPGIDRAGPCGPARFGAAEVGPAIRLSACPARVRAGRDR